MVIKYKASDLISDFNLNAKTTLTQLSETFGTEIKKSTVLTEEQANIAFEMYSKQGKIDNFATYLDKKAEPKAEAKKEAPKAEKQPQPKKEQPKDRKPAAQAPKADRQDRPMRDNKDRKDNRVDNRNKDNRQDNRQQPKKQENKPMQKPAQPAAKPAAQAPKAPHNPNEPLKRADGTVVETKTVKKAKEEKQVTERQEFVTVTVDTRQSNVNMDKFNEKYDELAGTKN